MAPDWRALVPHVVLLLESVLLKTQSKLYNDVLHDCIKIVKSITTSSLDNYFNLHFSIANMQIKVFMQIF